jgi:3-methyladenine DNA glycosylase AlkD
MPKPSKAALAKEAKSVVATLKKMGSKRGRDGLARFGIPSENALGIAVGKVRELGKRLGPNHDLAIALWQTGWLEARMLASFIDQPERVTPAQMDRWCGDFDNWGICDTVCFHLFDRTPHALPKIWQWAERRKEFEKRAAFALLACVALHDKKMSDESLLESLPLIEKAADDERNFVKKGVSWALRSIGQRSLELNVASVALAKRLAASADATERWIGKDTLRDITRPLVMKRLKAREQRAAAAR